MGETASGPEYVVVHRALWVLPIVARPVPDGEVAVAGGRIVAVGRKLAGDAYVDHDGVLIPGLVNAHTHLQYGPAFADLALQGLPFAAWIADVARRRAGMTEQSWLQEAEASAAQALSSGTTAVADVVSSPAVAAGRGPLQGISYIESVGIDSAAWASRERTRLAAAFDGGGESGDGGNDGAPELGVSPHTPYTIGTQVYGELVAFARARGRRMHPHVAESAAEVEFVATGGGPLCAMLGRFGLRMELLGRGSGLSPTAYVDSVGGLGSDVHIAHGVYAGAADRELLRRRGTAVALCTRSNRILQAGAAPVAAYRAEGNPVAVGTDSLSSSPDLDLLAELRALRELALAQGTSPAGLDEWLVRAATAGGALALGRGPGTPDPFGILAPGARADLAVVQGDPDVDPCATVVSGRAVATYLAGEKVFG